ncbi:fluoride efflux transporter FluC [Paenibacillus senegalensis]|uniref:fluoride efflux transporter FluC n=1 Tax=Paenibacillus senegalensis TaxID=1465766 RepID=UPI000289C712|nr:CrcB family protein [Paenibacillus senegalensis]
MLISSLAVAAGGFLGAISRYTIAIGMSRIPLLSFPWATLIVNVAGSFLIGGLTGSLWIHSTAGLAFGTGFLGAFTTLATFKLEVWKLILDKQLGKAAGYVAITYIIGVTAAYAGFRLGSQ